MDSFSSWLNQTTQCRDIRHKLTWFYSNTTVFHTLEGNSLQNKLNFYCNQTVRHWIQLLRWSLLHVWPLTWWWNCSSVEPDSSFLTETFCWLGNLPPLTCYTHKSDQTDNDNSDSSFLFWTQAPFLFTLYLNFTMKLTIPADITHLKSDRRERWCILFSVRASN